jgi:hypothetical protein
LITQFQTQRSKKKIERAPKKLADLIGVYSANSIQMMLTAMSFHFMYVEQARTSLSDIY